MQPAAVRRKHGGHIAPRRTATYSGRMKQFQDETDTSAATADAVIRGSWRVIRIVRAAVESRQTTDLTMTQLQTLSFLFSTPGASLSDVATHLGLQMPTTSKVVDSLVQQHRVARTSVPGNRRKLSLHITAAGRKVMGSAARPGMSTVAELLGQLTVRERRTVDRAMSLLQGALQPVLDPEQKGDMASTMDDASRTVRTAMPRK